MLKNQQTTFPYNAPQAKIEALKHAIDVGLNSESVECSYEDFMSQLEQEDTLIA